MKRILLFLLGFLLTSVIIFLLMPSPIEPVAWTPPKAPEMTGDYAVNDKLTNAEILFKGQCEKCEDVAIDSTGRIYGGQLNGDIVVFENGNRKVLTNTKGRPLGLHFDKEKNLIVADATTGLLSINTSTGKITTLVDEYEGKKMIFVDDVEIADDGTMYFSDASTKYGFYDNSLDILEGAGNGRLFAYYPAIKETKLLLDDLRFANGIAVAHDQSYVLVNETGRFRTHRYWLQGPKKGQSDLFIENLPGFPDGISQGKDGLFWIALVSPRLKSFDDLSQSTFMKNIVAKMPASLQPAAVHYGLVLGVDKNGTVKYNLQDPKGGFAEITSVQQFGQDIYLGSLYESGLAKYRLN